MPKRSWRDRGALLALIAVLVAVVLVAWFSQPTDSNPDQPHPRPPHAENDDGEPVSKRVYWGLFTADDTFAQWLMAFFTVAATLVSLKAVFLVRDSLELNRKATDAALKAAEHSAEANRIMREDQRPWVDLTVTITSAHVDRTGLRFLITIHLENIGKSPTYSAGPACITYAAPIDHSIIGGTSVVRHLHDSVADEFFMMPPRSEERNKFILPGGKVEFSQFQYFSRADWKMTKFAGEIMIHPVVAVHFPYFWRGGGEGQTSRVFALSLLKKGTKMGASLDSPTRVEVDIVATPRHHDTIR